MRIGILKAGYPAVEAREKFGDFHDIFARFLANRGIEFVSYAVVDMEFPQKIDECDGWIISGSKHGVYSAMDFIEPLENFIRSAYDASIPVVGICFGHQIMAQAFGGKVETSKQGWIIGQQEYEFKDGQKFCINSWHTDQVIQKPDNAQTIATNASCRYAGLAYGDVGLSFQAHPELENAFIRMYLEIYENNPETGLSAERVEKARAKLDKPVHSDLIADKIEAFFRKRGDMRAVPIFL